MTDMNSDSFYRPTGNVRNENRTFVPDLYRQVAAEMQEEDFETRNSAKHCDSNIIQLQKRPVVGVLYSISAGEEGELFPVYAGRNTIGSDFSCDICLRESSVSALHGILLARKQVNEEGGEYMSVMLSDSNSEYGTTVNGEKVNFERVVCSDGDVIGIGQNYVLVLSLFNALDKLFVAYGFDRLPDEENADENNKLIQDKNGNPTEDTSSINIMGGMYQEQQSAPVSVPQGAQEEDVASSDFYKPTKQRGQDHYNNKTIIL